MINHIVDALSWRNATKTFDPSQRVSENNLNALLQVLRLTPSSYGLQPWKFVVVENVNLKEELFAASYGQEQIRSASHVLILCTQKVLKTKDVDKCIEKISEVRGLEPCTLQSYRNMMISSINDMDEDKLLHWLSLQCYIALGFLLFACSLLQIDSCPMEGFIAEEYDRILGLSDRGLTSVIVCPIGYRDQENSHNFEEKVRYDLNELVIYA